MTADAERSPHLPVLEIKPDHTDLPDVDVVREIVINAARDARLDRFALRNRAVKDDGGVVTETDHRVQAFISKELINRWPTRFNDPSLLK